MNPGDRPRKAISTALGVAVAVAAVTGIIVVADTDRAAAGELERFASCEALAAWGQADARADFDEGSAGAGTTGGAADGAPLTADASADSQAAGAPSTPAAGTSAERSSAEEGDDTNVIVAGVDELDVIDRIDAGHVLVAAASRLSIVDVVDDEVVANLPVASSVQITYDRDNGIAWVVGPDDDTSRLTVTRVAVTSTALAEQASWATDGWLVDARRVGDRLHVVAADGYEVGIDDAADDAADEAVPFESGPVPCDRVLHPVIESDRTATLLVTLPAEGALEPEHATEVVGSGEYVHVTTDAAYLATPLYGETTQTSVHRFDLDDLALTGSGRVDGSLLSQFSMSDFDDHLRLAVTDQSRAFGRAIEGDMVMPETVPDQQSPLNEVVVLDTVGSLDVVGRTPRFGHPGETLQGVRFDGAVAYAVTFLQTDPFYVLDLSDPTTPKVVGDVELPGFSSYLHPVGDGLVAGFGPDGDGRIAVKLFDVSDRSRPTVVDTLELGDESPITWDHHAFVDLGDGRFAVPASSYREQTVARCTEPQAELKPDDCLYPGYVAESAVVVIDTTGGRLQLVQRLGAVRGDGAASRAVQTDDGWALLTANHWVVLDGRSGDQVADLQLGPGVAVRPLDDLGAPVPGGTTIID